MHPILLAAAEDSELKVLPHTDELLWGSIAFLLLLVVLIKYAFPKLNQGLAARAAKIRSEIEGAEQSRLEAQRVLDEYKAQLADARAEAGRIIEEARKSAEQIRRDLEARAQQEAQEIVARARQEVGAERDRALQELRSTIGDLSIQLAQKVVERELSDPESQRAMVRRMIEELATAGRATGNGHGR